MATTAWLTEDWGTTHGTAGANGLAFANYDSYGWQTTSAGGTKLFWTTCTTGGLVNPDIISGGTKVGAAYQNTSEYYRYANRAAGMVSTLFGTLTGSQYHVGSWSRLSSRPVWLRVPIAEYGGTLLYAEMSMQSSNTYAQICRTVTTSGTGTVLASGTLGTYYSGTYLLDTSYSGGTWTARVTLPDLGGTNGSAVYGAGTNFAPSTCPPTIGAQALNNYLQLLESRWEYTPNPSDSILYFVGTWANGSGTRQFGDHVIGFPSAVTDRGRYPGDHRGWASTVNVTIDDSTGVWGSFAGTSNAWYDGTWYLQRYFPLTWTRLLTGFVEPNDVEYDYAAKLAKITIQSSIVRFAQRLASYDGTTESGRGYAVSQQSPLRIAGYNSGGSVFLYTASHWRVENGCTLWSTVGTTGESVVVGSSITDPGGGAGTGTITLSSGDDLPDWLKTTDAYVYATNPWPWYDVRNAYESHAWKYTVDVVNSMGIGTGGTADWLIYKKTSEQSPVNPGARFYGGERLIDALGGLMDATGGFYSVSPTGEFRARCLVPSTGSSGTIDFNAAYDSDWSASYEPTYCVVELDCNHNPDTGSFASRVRAGGTTQFGEAYKKKMEWLGSGIAAQSLANRIYQNHKSPRAALRLRFAGSTWSSYLPGETYQITNLPAHLATLLGAGTLMVCYARTYTYENDLTEIELVAAPPTGQYAFWDATPADTWHDSGKVWY